MGRGGESLGAEKEAAGEGKDGGGGGGRVDFSYLTLSKLDLE